MFEKFFLKKRWGKGRKADAINELINRKCHLIVKNTDLSIELLETLEMIRNCTNCKDKNHFIQLYTSINEIENLLVKLEREQEKEKEKIINELNNKLIKIDFELNKWKLCEDCKEKKL